jgi:hypothetical protein
MFSARVVVLPRMFRVINLIRTIRIIRHRDHFKTSSRHLVGQNKNELLAMDLILIYVVSAVCYVQDFVR